MHATYGVVEEEADVAEAEEPGKCRRTRTVQEGVGHAFDGLESTFGGVLILAVGFTLPRIDDQCTEVLECLFADLRLGAVTEEFSRGTAASYVVLQRAEELAIGLASIDVTNLGLGADIELSARGAVVDGGCVRVDVVSGNGFVATDDIEGWKLRFMVSLEDRAVGHAGMLCRFRKCAFNDLSREVTKEWAKTSIIRLAGNNRAFMRFEINGICRNDVVFKFLVCVEEVVCDGGSVDEQGLTNIAIFIEHRVNVWWRIGEGVIPLCIVIAVVVED
jgi:hypothetical protein